MLDTDTTDVIAANSILAASIGELTQRDRADLMECKNFGRKGLNEVRTQLAALGLSLAGEATNVDA